MLGLCGKTNTFVLSMRLRVHAINNVRKKIAFIDEYEIDS